MYVLCTNLCAVGAAEIYGRLIVRAAAERQSPTKKTIYMYFMCTIAVYSEKFYNKN